VARLTALLALCFILTVPALPILAADQTQTTSANGTKAKPVKPVPAKPHRAKPGAAKVPTVKAPAAKPVQPAPAVQPVLATPPETKPVAGKSGDAKPVEVKATPHFASLRAEKVNLRSGPSADFPIQWVFVRRGLPVEILATFDIWRKIRDADGTIGWVNQQMLSGRRSVLVAAAVRDLRHDPDATSEVIAQLEPGVVAAVSKCDPAWCEVKAGGYKGWLKRDQVWGLEPDEVIQ
jgi:SH3-like domain-containing protein